MEKILDIIINKHKDIFGDNPSINKINIGFTNTIYDIDNKYIVKICSDINNEGSFKKEIEFYKLNKDSSFIPKLYYSNIDKELVPYMYEIIEKINGVSLYSVWHTLSEEKKESIINELCMLMKEIHSHKGSSYDWTNYIKKEYVTAYNKIDKYNIFNYEEKELLNEAYSLFDKYLDSNEFVLVHNDLHFDNILYVDGHIKLIDFERSMYAPIDFELDIINRMIRKPWKFANEEDEKNVKKEDYDNIMSYIKKYYNELLDVPNINKRLAIYDIVYYLKQLEEYPKLEELKLDVLEGIKKVLD